MRDLTVTGVRRVLFRSLGAPVLDDCHAYFECAVANAMDTGSSTCFLGDVVDVGYGNGGASRPGGGGGGGGGGGVMTAAHFRANMPPAWRGENEGAPKAAPAFPGQASREDRKAQSLKPRT